MSVANSGLAGSISGLSGLSATVAANTTSITKLEPLIIIVDAVANSTVSSGAAHYAFVGKPQSGAVDGIYLFNISFELETASTSLDVLYGIENTAAGANHVLGEKVECTSGCRLFFSYSGVVEITSVSPNVGIVIEPTTTGPVTNLTSGAMTFTRIKAI